MFLIEISGEQSVVFVVSDDVLLRHRTYVQELHECPLGGNRLHCEFTEIDRAWAERGGRKRTTYLPSFHPLFLFGIK